MLILLRVVFFLRKNLDEALSTDLFAKASSSFQDQKNLHHFLGQPDITVVLNLASNSAETDKRAQEIQELKEELAKKEAESVKMKAETDAKLALMQDQMAAILAAVKPTRKKSVTTEEA